MAPRLPTELLNEILSLVNLDATPVERQLNRQRFGFVCRDWHASVDWWKEVAVVGATGISAFLVALANPTTAKPSALVSLHVEAGLNSLVQLQLADPLSRASNLSALALINTRPSERRLSSTLLASIALLGRLHRLALHNLTVAGLGSAGPWPALAELTVGSGTLAGRATPRRAVPIPPTLSQQQFESCIQLMPPSQLSHPLPPELWSAILAHRPALLGHPPIPPLPPLADPPSARPPAPTCDLTQLQPLADQLTHLTVTQVPGSAEYALSWPAFGRLEHLTVDIAAACGLLTGSKRLPRVARLAVRSGGGRSMDLVAVNLAGRIKHVNWGFAGLQAVELDRPVWDGCQPGVQDTMRAAAADRSVELTIS